MKPTLEPKRKPRKKHKFVGRPWLLGIEDIPPPMDVPFQMWSKSSDPHQQGLIQFEFSPEGISAGWFYEGKDVIPWHELAWFAGELHPDIKREIEFLKEKAEVEGFAVGMARALKVWQDKIIDKPFLASYGESVKEALAEISDVFEKYPSLKECI